MADGSEKPIADVRVGDKVLATDPETGQSEARPVTALIRHRGKHTMVDLTLSDGSNVSTTDHHPFWDATTRKFTDAIDLQLGDRVLTDNGRTLTIAETHVYDRNLTAYNLQIDGIHTYYVGRTPILVHNSCSDEAFDISMKAFGTPGRAEGLGFKSVDEMGTYIDRVMGGSRGVLRDDGARLWRDGDRFVVRGGSRGDPGSIFRMDNPEVYWQRQMERSVYEP